MIKLKENLMLASDMIVLHSNYLPESILSVILVVDVERLTEWSEWQIWDEDYISGYSMPVQ